MNVHTRRYRRVSLARTDGDDGDDGDAMTRPTVVSTSTSSPTATPRENVAARRDGDGDGDVVVLDVEEEEDAGGRVATRDGKDVETKPRGGGGVELSMKRYFRPASIVDGETSTSEGAGDVGDENDGGSAREKRRRDEPRIVIESAPDERAFTTKSIGGCEVKFPEGLSPHPAQVMTMSSIIRALNKKENSMIESPTGTGKTLALLCGALAWQEKESKNPEGAKLYKAWVKEREKYEAAKARYDAGLKSGKRVEPEFGDGWMSSDPHFRRAPPPEATTPKIYMCTRTHSQISQILRELKRTGYSPKYSVLSSRQRMCPYNKSDTECRELIKAKGGVRTSTDCGYYNRHQRAVRTMARFEENGMIGHYPAAWDMEDFDRVIEHEDACPFYTLRGMAEDASLIFCPYNYLFDINVRRKMGLKIDGAAVIIDEGHNLEDVCREGSSAELSLDEIGKYADELAKNHGRINEQTTVLSSFFRSISNFLEEQFRVSNSPDAIVVSSNQVKTLTDDMLKDCPDHLATIDEIVEELMTTKSDLLTPTTAPAIGLAGDIAVVLTLVRTNPTAYNVIFGRNMDIDGDTCPGIAFQCMQPAVAFHQVARDARSIILTSGTLSPMTTFEAELGVKFASKIEAPHVIPTNQVHVEVCGALGEITYKATEGDVQGSRFAKNLGSFLLRYAKIIPGGMLVFLPKYSLIDRIFREWHITGVFSELSAFKRVCVESRGSRGFQETLNEFDRGNKKGKGSLMLAVYRGKVSEGIDFKDDAARAVFCVGIPFPSMFDVKVKAKRNYNDSPYCKERGMLPGGEWYRAQAYRAYNQALGRCIRHPKDYAALFLVDSRFLEGGVWMMNNISKWIRRNVTACHNINDSVRTVDEFFKRLRDPEAFGANADANANADAAPPPKPIEGNKNFLRGVGHAKNKPLVDALDAMCEASMQAGEDPKRTNAYSKALVSIRALQVEVTSGAKISKSGPDKVPNVGPSIGAQIDYFFANGVFERHAFYEKGELPPS